MRLGSRVGPGGDVWLVNQTLRGQKYEDLKRRARGLVRRYVEKMTGLSRAQPTRLITQYVAGEPVQVKPYRGHRFPQRYTREDIDLLAAMDELHQTLSGQATQKLLQRAYYDFKGSVYERCSVSVSVRDKRS